MESLNVDQILGFNIGTDIGIISAINYIYNINPWLNFVVYLGYIIGCGVIVQEKYPGL